jgi:hypothetical protein
MQSRNVAFVGAIGVIIGWLVASTVTPPVARVQTRPADRERPVEATADVPFTGELHLRLQQRHPAPERRRNPFVFATRESERGVRAAESQTAAIDAPAPEPVVVGPSYVLSGIGISGDSRTAILTTTGADVHIVKIDDEIGGYTIVEISQDTVTLAKGAERHVLRFPLVP